MAHLVVITGPIASGKSTVADRLAEHVRATGGSAVAVDLDDVVATLRAPASDFEQSWRRARAVHGALVAAWLHAGVDVVIAHGPFAAPEEVAALVDRVPPTVIPRWALLMAPYPVALERVTGDPQRVLSRDPDFLRYTHERFRSLLPDLPACEWTFDTTAMSADDIVQVLAHL